MKNFPVFLYIIFQFLFFIIFYSYLSFFLYCIIWFLSMDESFPFPSHTWTGLWLGTYCKGILNRSLIVTHEQDTMITILILQDTYWPPVCKH